MGRHHQPHVAGPAGALAELNLPYERRPIRPRTGETKTDAFTRLTARQKVPVLQDGDLVLTESAAIVAYLSDRYGQRGKPATTCPIQQNAPFAWNGISLLSPNLTPDRYM